MPIELWARLRARLRGLFRRDGVAGEIHEELEFHVRMRADEFERAGATRPAAVQLARERFGNVAVWQDRGYDVRGGGLMETVVQDLKYGVRLLFKQPGFSVIAILTLALGIGMTTAIASVIDAAMLHPLPYPNPHELVELHLEVPRPDGSGQVSRFGPARIDLDAIRAAPDAPVTVSMWRSIFRSPVADGPEPERLRGYEIDEHYLGLFGVAPVRGRAIQAQDTREGAPPVVMIGYGYWQRRFAGRDDAVGQRLQLDDESVEIIGVMPMSFYRTTALWKPLKLSSEMAGVRGSGAATYGRLRPGVTIDYAKGELVRAIGASQATTVPLRPGWSVRVRTLLERETVGYWTTANILFGAVALILLIACVNVAGLLMARGATRMHEVAIRASIGAGRGRLIRQLLTESMLLSIAGAMVGVGVAWLTLDTLVSNIPLPLSTNAPATLNWRVLSLSLGLALLTGLLFGLMPALRLSRVSVTHALSRGTRRTGSGLSRRGGQWLIGTEIALALVLVTGAGLMIRSFGKLVAVDLGFDPDRILTLQATPADLKSDVFSNYYAQLVEAIRQMPDVEHAGAINHLPLMGSHAFGPIELGGGVSKSATLRQILPGYFEAMGLQATAGRLPSQSDVNSGPGVAVVTERGGRQLFPDGSAVGRTVVVDKQPYQIIGIVPELKVDGAQSRREYAELFRLYRPNPGSRPDSMVIVVRPRGTAVGLAERLRQIALGVGPRAIVERVKTGNDWLADTVTSPRQRTVLLGLLGGLGLLLTLIGVFGMTAYAVARRTQEIGVRMAFGATAASVVRAMVADAAWPVTIGVAVGLGGSWYATQLISSFLFEMTPTDASTFGAAAATLAAAALIAVWIPARRAARVDPVRSLRVE